MLVLLLPTCVASDVSAGFVSADVEALEGGAVSTLAEGFCAGVVFVKLVLMSYYFLTGEYLLCL